MCVVVLDRLMLGDGLTERCRLANAANLAALGLVARGCMRLTDRTVARQAESDMALHKHLPEDMCNPVRLPGVAPLDMAQWILVDEAYEAQMARRCALLQTNRNAVHAMLPDALHAATEALECVLEQLKARAGFVREGNVMTTPDGRAVDLRDDPLLVLGQLIQEDICILQKPRDATEHVLTAAVLCFPANWRLAQKIGRPLLQIHAPVEEYTSDLARRVQRLFDGVREGRPLWRYNALWYENPELFQPKRSDNRWSNSQAREGNYYRTERQCIVRLPATQAVVFSIHTYVLEHSQALKFLNAQRSQKHQIN